MELTNLIWHLGAALAALWAALAYRRLSAHYTDLRNSVLLSVLPVHQPTIALPSSSQALSPAERSMRVRTLGWVSREMANCLGTEIVLEGRDALMSVQQEQWVHAIAGLMSFSAVGVRPQSVHPFFDQLGEPLTAEKMTHRLAESKESEKTIKLKWQIELQSGRGGWQWLEM